MSFFTAAGCARNSRSCGGSSETFGAKEDGIGSGEGVAFSAARLVFAMSWFGVGVFSGSGSGVVFARALFFRGDGVSSASVFLRDFVSAMSGATDASAIELAIKMRSQRIGGEGSITAQSR